MNTREGLLTLAGLGGALVLASLVALILRLRAGPQPNPVLDNLSARIKAWWVMIGLLGGAFLAGRTSVIVLFALVSFFALREFLTLTRTRRGDHAAIFISFFVVLPMQYWLIWANWYGFFAILIPVYAFLILPIVAVLSGDTHEFMARTAETQWGLMISVYCISHVPALLTLDIPGYQRRNALLMVFLLIVVQSSDVLQYVWGKLLGRHKIAPALSPSKTVEGFVGGIALGNRPGRLPVAHHAVSPVAGRGHGAGRDVDGLSGRVGDVGHQARPRREGLGQPDRRPRRHVGPAGFGGLLRADLFSPDKVLLHAVRGRMWRRLLGTCFLEARLHQLRDSEDFPDTGASDPVDAASLFKALPDAGDLRFGKMQRLHGFGEAGELEAFCCVPRAPTAGPGNQAGTCPPIPRVQRLHRAGTRNPQSG